ncbi:hypothetical protein [Paracoccus shanxieyensis]|uniref:SGNH/GDSL hydrolase family protein n=1 Tax=Paracoccus shanxieyensis TaxID=2675752 RepID=A0A6L6J680_9RHOB|nr:hypothetical protein [Paracoccus shanxieyensis]MTH66750.1 hypothetical protein [Paracoccus shanxieyensis]MTH89986.1 hypothetical protein [Paracoccus shanxieyensis]
MLMDLLGVWPPRRRGAGALALPRVSLTGDEGLGASAHSFLAFAIQPAPAGGDFAGLWSGPVALNYEGFSSLRQRWELNRADRTAAYSGALLLTEIGDLATGLADPASPQGIETLQYLWRYTMAAQAKGCRMVVIYPPWGPEGSDMDADAMAKARYWQDWLRARPEITVPVYLMPVPVIVRGFINMHAPESIYSDGLHLRGPADPPPNENMRALAHALRMMLTGRPETDDPVWSEDLRAMVSIAWAAIASHACTGLGGSVHVAPYPVASDPLPDPTVGGQ